MQAAQQLALGLVQRDISLVYGGASIGLMGSLASEVMRLGGSVTGVIPETLVDQEVAHKDLTQLVVTPSMHARKTTMAELADGFVAMPGGIGTLEEIFEVWTWAQLRLHQKPCGLLNVDGFFDPLLRFLDRTVDDQFVKQEHRDMVIVESTPDRLLDHFYRYSHPETNKWYSSAPRDNQS